MKAIDTGIVDNEEYQFTWRQHFLPLSCMKRFCRQDKRIFVVDKLASNVFFRKLRDHEPGAVAARAWTQHAEKVFFFNIETPFFKLSSDLILGKNSLTELENTILTNYLSLWRARFEHRINTNEVIKLAGISEPELSIHQKQNLEKNYAAVGGVITSYELNSILVQSAYDSNRLCLKNIKWVVHRLKIGDCILPDHTELLIIPISPEVVLLPIENEFDCNSKDSISNLNFQLISESQDYYYARDINRVIYC